MKQNGWNNDFQRWPVADGPFFIRGGRPGSGYSNGLFAFIYSSGAADYFIWDGFRAVLVVE